MPAPQILATEQTTENTDHYFETKRFKDVTIPEPIIVLLRNLQTQLDAANARIAALEGA